MSAEDTDACMCDLNDLLVKPWTQGNGCSLATLMSAAQPCDARLMVCNVRITAPLSGACLTFVWSGCMIAERVCFRSGCCGGMHIYVSAGMCVEARV